jgi:hypothetical protein
MNSAPSTPQQVSATASGEGSHQGQRFGHVTAPEPITAVLQTYLVRDDETGITYPFGYADIVAEGLRTVRTGERVRFLIDPHDRQRASYIVRLDLPDIEEYYG